MSGLVDAAAQVMRMSSQQLDSTALNVANVSTPAYKRQLRSSSLDVASFNSVLSRLRVDHRAGKLIETGRTLDIAINGDGYFQLRSGDRTIYSRQGALSLDPSGRLVTAQGDVLQQAGGGDLTPGTAAITVATDGSVSNEDGRTLGRIALVRPRDVADLVAIDGSTFAIADEAAEAIDAPSVRQGALEASNVSLGDEMIATMAALRGAETGARLVQVYDDLMGKAISTFAQVGR